MAMAEVLQQRCSTPITTYAEACHLWQPRSYPVCSRSMLHVDPAVEKTAVEKKDMPPGAAVRTFHDIQCSSHQ
jgi:hypothetical protein